MLISPFLLLDLFVVTVMFAIGLRVSRSDLMSALRNRRLLLRSLLANCVVVPVLGFLLVGGASHGYRPETGIAAAGGNPGDACGAAIYSQSQRSAWPLRQA